MDEFWGAWIRLAKDEFWGAWVRLAMAMMNIVRLTGSLPWCDEFRGLWVGPGLEPTLLELARLRRQKFLKVLGGGKL